MGWSAAPAAWKDTGLEASEKVDVTITMRHFKGTVHVDCVFVFQNNGPACTVRMGFPDKGTGGVAEGYAEDAQGKEQAGGDVVPYAGLDSFRSWVDGRKVATRLVNGKPAGDAASWHTKVVHFDANQRRIVRESYTQRLGGGATASSSRKTNGVYIYEAMYQMNTGRSWSGQIGRAELTVRVPFKIRRASMINDLDAYTYAFWGRVGRGHVYYAGFAKPSVSGNTLHFIREKFKPTKRSDVHVFWPVPHGRDINGDP